jgi:hypothetical protein
MIKRLISKFYFNERKTDCLWLYEKDKKTRRAKYLCNTPYPPLAIFEVMRRLQLITEIKLSKQQLKKATEAAFSLDDGQGRIPMGAMVNAWDDIASLDVFSAQVRKFCLPNA